MLFQTAFDNHEALKDFFVGFPEFAENDFYVTGESYAGIYVPTLSARLVDDPNFNFKVRVSRVYAVVAAHRNVTVSRLRRRRSHELLYLRKIRW